MATLYENYITGDDGQQSFYSSTYVVQTSTPQINHILTSIKVKLWRGATAPGNVFANAIMLVYRIVGGFVNF